MTLVKRTPSLAWSLLLAACGATTGTDPVADPSSSVDVRDTPVDTDTDTDTDSDTDTDTDSDTDTDTDPHTGDTDTGDTDSGHTGDTDTGTSHTGETDTSGPDTDTDTGEPGNTDTSLAVDTGETGVPVDTGVSVDTGVPVDTGVSVDTSDPADTGTPVDTGISVDTSVPADTSAPPDTSGSGDSGDPPDTSVSTETGTTPETGSPADTGKDTDPPDSGADDTSESDTTPPDTSAPDTAGDTAADSGDSGDTGSSGSAIRFVALGDAGTGGITQYDVGAAIASVCATEGCDFALYLGDNFYPSGVVDTADLQWTFSFEMPYAGLSFPFYVVLGNHDYGSGYDVSRAQAQVDYSAGSSKWVMPDFYYTETIGDLTLVAIDTQAIGEGYGADQEAWIPGALASITTSWSIAIGHHPYLSNGPHGNAGEYDGMPGNGTANLDFFTDYICGQVDIYLCGHDHSLQWLEESCGTQFLVSGGGSSGSVVGVGTNPTYFEAASPGFLWVELDGDTMTGVFYDDTGAELYRGTYTR